MPGRESSAASDFSMSDSFQECFKSQNIISGSCMKWEMEYQYKICMFQIISITSSLPSNSEKNTIISRLLRTIPKNCDTFWRLKIKRRLINFH